MADCARARWKFSCASVSAVQVSVFVINSSGLTVDVQYHELDDCQHFTIFLNKTLTAVFGGMYLTVLLLCGFSALSCSCWYHCLNCSLDWGVLCHTKGDQGPHQEQDEENG